MTFLLIFEFLSQINGARTSKLLIVICLLLSTRPSSQSITFKPSPCPETFNYERTEDGSDRWYGDINWKINQTINGVSFRITFDRPVQLLVVSIPRMRNVSARMYWRIYQIAINYDEGLFLTVLFCRIYYNGQPNFYGFRIRRSTRCRNGIQGSNYGEV